MDDPRPTDFPAPAAVIIAGQQAKKSSTNVSAPPDGTSTPQPPSVSTSDSAPETEEKQHPEPAAGGGGVSLPPPLPKVASGRGNSRGSKAAAAAGGGGGGGGGYKPPSWGLATAPDASGLSLTVLKGGIEVGSISLDSRTHILLGRQQGVVDVLLEHPSISRKHAILQHGQNGALFLLDNGSTHGCSVNKTKIPPKEFHKLNVGDVIKFGESTRLYALEGPEELRPAEYESDNLRNLRLEAGRKQLAKKLAKLKAGVAGRGAGEEGGGDSGEYGISWGFDEDAVAEDEDEDGEGMEGDDGEVELPDYLKTEAQKRRRRDTKVGLSEDSVHKRDAKLFEKLQLKLTKVEHLLTENERITAKEGGQGGLTEGQQAQLGRNDKAVTSIRLQIEEIEETIRSKNKARERGKEGGDGGEEGGKPGAVGGGEGGGAAEAGDEDDDYYDRTAPVAPASARTLEGGAISKKEEIRARRFGARNKAKKLSLVPANGAAGTAAAALAATGRGKLGGGSLEGGGDETVAQSLEALTRRADAVAQDLERTESGLVELEVEEAEDEAEEEAGAKTGAGGDGVAADPLDMFMAGNRKNERRQAVLRLTAQRDSLREERTLLKAMVEAARPSMPSLKPAAANPVAAGKDVAAAAAAVPGKSRDSSLQQLLPLPSPPSPSGEALAAGGVLSKKSSEGEEQEEMEEPVVRVSRHANDGEGATDCGGRSVEAELPPVSASMGAPAALPRRPEAAADRTTPITAQAEAAEDRGGVRGNGNSKSDIDPTRDNKDGAPSSCVPQEEAKKSGSSKKRGTPVGASMLPPPPSKRPQPKQSTSTADSKEDLRSVPSSAKRAVKGPAAMPPPAAASVSPGSLTAGATGVKEPREGEAKGTKGGAAGGVKVAGKGVLEGGDADWVPPKGQAGDGRTALNLKFGY